MLKFLEGVVGSGGSIKDLPYEFGEPYSTAWGGWTHCRGTSKDDNSPVSIFSFTGSSAQDARLAAARNGAKRLRVVRHPNVLAFLHSTEAESTDGGVVKPTIYLVTEPVMPLADKIRELNLQGTQREEYYAWGLHQIATAVSFLNNDCKLVHGNICLASVVVTATLDWKLHGLDVLSEFDGGNPAATGPMLEYDWLVGTQHKALELAKSDWTVIRKSPPWALDSWGLGCLIFELFSNTKLSKTEDLQNTSNIPKTLLPDYQKLLGSVPARRLNSSELLENSEFFHNKLVETIQFMEVLNLKDSVEKDIFFRKLPNLADQLPRPIVVKKLLPLLASALEFGSAAAPALNPLLKMGSWLPQDEFNVKVLPTVIKLFASSDRAIRVGLLQHIDTFGAGLSTQVVDEQIFPHIATGFADTSAFLRELTLKSMLLLAPKLTQQTITGSLLKHLSKLEVDEEPAIRTNTTILLGHIAVHLNDATRKRVSINAFTVQALQDQFPPASGAGVNPVHEVEHQYQHQHQHWVDMVGSPLLQRGVGGAKEKYTPARGRHHYNKVPDVRRAKVDGYGLQPAMVSPAAAKEGVVASNFLEQDAAYFQAYSHVGIHEEMIKDRARTDAYRDAIFFHADFIRDKVVVDVGCGTGILSIFCAFAGARKVYAVDASDIAVKAREVVKANNLTDIITVLHGRVEEVHIDEEVDVIVSEWMGYMLLYESMLASVVCARDRWLKPGGLMLPSFATLYMAPITNNEKYHENIDFWRSVYGIDMSAMIPLAKQCSFEEPCIESIPAENVLSWPVVVKQIDCNTVTIEELETVKADFCVSSIMMASLHGFAIWFDVSFGTRVIHQGEPHTDSSPGSSGLSGGHDDDVVGSNRPKKRANPSDCVTLSTAPDATPTHWAQTILYVYDPIKVTQDQEISGSIELSQSRENPRFLNIHLKYRSGDRECVKESVMR